jgi:8-oxo-dGTP pyrophosphatase MutT (NUDIX family)
MQYQWYRAKDWHGLAPIVQVHGVCFDALGSIMIIREPGKEWHLVGGKPESGETFEETLRREVNEETHVTLKSCGMIGYQKAIRDNGECVYQLRFAAIIEDIGEQRPDPTTGFVNERAFVPAKDIACWVNYKEIIAIVAAATEWLADHR